MTSGVVQVQTTLPDESAAQRLANDLVGRRLAACVQVLGPVTSRYWWNGAIEAASEWLCLIKTTPGCVPALQGQIRSLHPYTNPEIIVLPVLGGDPEYLEWVRAEAREEGGAEQGV
jgi:periplasmic divalent cation tolerance protein